MAGSRPAACRNFFPFLNDECNAAFNCACSTGSARGPRLTRGGPVASSPYQTQPTQRIKENTTVERVKRKHAKLVQKIDTSERQIET